MTPENMFQQLDYYPQQTKESFELIYNQYAPFIYGLLVNATCHNDDKAQTLTIQIFKTVFYQLHQYKPAKGRLFTWIYLIAKNELKASGIELLRPGANSKSTHLTH